jgi:[ribosomal protein S5]-alanine N-acetyltransferase
MSTRLETARLVIRTFEPRDAEAWVAMLSDPEVLRFLPPGPAPTMEMFQGAIKARHAMEREGGYAMWAVDERRTGTLVGQCGLRPVDSMQPQAGAAAAGGPARREFDLAYHYTRACWGQGYGTEAAMAVLAYGLGPLGLGCIIAVAMPDNVGSWRVMEKAGMRYEGLADYYGLEGLKKYVAEPEWWRPPA